MAATFAPRPPRRAVAPPSIPRAFPGTKYWNDTHPFAAFQSKAGAAPRAQPETSATRERRARGPPRSTIASAAAARWMTAKMWHQKATPSRSPAARARRGRGPPLVRPACEEPQGPHAEGEDLDVGSVVVEAVAGHAHRREGRVEAGEEGRPLPEGAEGEAVEPGHEHAVEGDRHQGEGAGRVHHLHQRDREERFQRAAVGLARNEDESLRASEETQSDRPPDGPVRRDPRRGPVDDERETGDHREADDEQEAGQGGACERLSPQLDGARPQPDEGEGSSDAAEKEGWDRGERGRSPRGAGVEPAYAPGDPESGRADPCQQSGS